MRKLFIACFVLFSVMMMQGQVTTERSDYFIGTMGAQTSINIRARVEVVDGYTTKKCVFKGYENNVYLTVTIHESELITLIEKIEEMKVGDFNSNCDYFDKYYH